MIHFPLMDWGDTCKERNQKKTSEVFKVKNGIESDAASGLIGSTEPGIVVKQREDGGNLFCHLCLMVKHIF